MRRRVPLAAALLAAALAAPSSASALALPADGNALISDAPDLQSVLPTPAGFVDLFDNGRAIDQSGIHVVFSSTSDGLLDGDDDDVENVYVENTVTGAVTLASRANGPDGAPAHESCSQGTISADGTHVAFTCDGPLDPADANGVSDIYERDLVHGTTTLVSRAPGAGGAAGDAASGQPSISADGSFVAFQSSASNLAPPGPVPATRAFRRDVAAGQTQLVTTAVSSFGPSISANGRMVAFATSTQLDPADTNFVTDVYLRDMAGGAPTLISRGSADGPVGNQSSELPQISGDGTRVAFESNATTFDPADKDTDNSVYVRTLASAQTRLLGLVAGAKLPDTRVEGIDSDGGIVTLTSNRNAYVVDVTTGIATPVSVADPPNASQLLGGVTAAAISGDGSLVAYRLNQGVTADVAPDQPSLVVRQLPAGTDANRTISRPAGAAPFVNAGGDATLGSVSADGRWVAFVSTAPGLGVPAGGVGEVFVRDTLTAAVQLASRADGPGGAPLTVPLDGPAPSISADGRRIAFVPFSDDRGHVLVRDVAQGRTFVADVSDATGAPLGPTGSVLAFSLSGDGSRVAFSSFDPLAGDAPDGQFDVYVRDLASGHTLLVDRATGAQGAKAAKGAGDPQISADGRRVAFDTTSGLAAADADAVRDVYVRDLDAGTTTLARGAGAATKGDGDSFAVGLDGDGGRVLLRTRADNLGAAGPAPTKLFVRDLAAQTIVLAGRADGPAGADVSDLGDTLTAALSADGRHVAFAASPTTSIAPGGPADGAPRVYERDLASGVTRLISRRPGAGGAPDRSLPDGPVPAVDLTADGACVAFDGTGSLATPAASTDHVHVFLRAVAADCGRPQPQPPAGNGGGSGGGGQPGAAAVLSRLALKPARFHVGGRAGGTKISFRLDRAAPVTLAFDRLLPGRRARRKGARCSTKPRHGGVRCTVVKRFGRLALAQSKLHAGTNTVRFSGRIGRKALAPGRYRLTATPLHGKARTVTFLIVKAPRRRPPHRR